MPSGQRKREKESKRQKIMYPILKKPLVSWQQYLPLAVLDNRYIKGISFILKKAIAQTTEILMWQQNRIYHIPITTRICQNEYCNSQGNSRLKGIILLQENILPPGGKRLLRNLNTPSLLTLMILLQNVANSFANRRSTMGFCVISALWF